MPSFTFDILKESVKHFLNSPMKGLQFLRDNCEPTELITKNLDKLEVFIKTGIPQFSIWVPGNDKLKFLSFSSVSGEYTCRGAGDCLKFCYTFRGWRNFVPFMRQIQNLLLLQTDEGFAKIAEALDKHLKRRKFKNRIVDIRLYVDGDFKDQREIDQWFGILALRPHVRAYGYSKSLDLFYKMAKDGANIPFNYKLNLSTGGKFDYLHDKIMEIRPDWVRGRFVAVPTVKKSMKKLDKNDKKIMRLWAKETFGQDSKSFVCPSKCGSCTKHGHACGLETFNNINILIPVH